jgi:hypothetical protein
MRSLLLLCAVVLLFACTSAYADYPYEVTDLGVFQPLAVNGNGTALGLISSSPFSSPVLATYSKGLVDLIPNDHSLFFSGISAAAYTDSGTIAFSANVTTNSTNTTQFGAPVIYKNGSYTVVPNVTGLQGIPNSWGLNNAGVVAGNVSGVGNFVFDGTSTTTTSTNDRYFAFNNLNQQLGVVRQAPFGLTMVVNNSGTITTLLDSRGNPLFITGPSVINDNEYAIIAGQLGIINGSLFSVLPGVASGSYVSLAANNLAVGAYIIPGGGNGTTTRALYFNGTTGVDLNSLIDPTSGWILTSATWVGDTGYIIGQGTDNGVAANFLLTPVPEPVASGLLLISGTLLFSRRRKQVFNRGAL